MEPFTCSCGIKTREPFLVNGELVCVICADKSAPRLVNSRTTRNWQQFQNEARSTPRAGFRNRWASDET